jgi:hypothetical protein
MESQRIIATVTCITEIYQIKFSCFTAKHSDAQQSVQNLLFKRNSGYR